jgi:hypothetical protein
VADLKIAPMHQITLAQLKPSLVALSVDMMLNTLGTGFTQEAQAF